MIWIVLGVAVVGVWVLGARVAREDYVSDATRRYYARGQRQVRD